MTNIPDDVMHLCILPRLPVKSLIRFKCVSKSWQALINSPDFIQLHHRHALSSDKNRLLIVCSTPLQRFQLHDLDSPSAPPVLLPYPKPATCTTPMVVRIVATCEYFILLKCILRHPCEPVIEPKTEFYELFLLNPATCSYYRIPNQSSLRWCIADLVPAMYGLYIDKANDDFKIVRIVQDQYVPPTDIFVMVYSNKTNSWKLIEEKFDVPYCMSNVVVIGHLLHTIFPSTEWKKKIGCFDIVEERWDDDLPLPEQIDAGKCIWYDLCLFDGLLCVSVLDHLNKDTYHVWVMKEYCVKESWVKLMNIAPYKCIPVTYLTGSRHELLCRRCPDLNLFWYNIRSKGSKQVEFDGCSCGSGQVCKGSLVRFPGGQQFNTRRT